MNVDYCNECAAYGDDCYENDEGEPVCRRPGCPKNRDYWEDWDEQK